MFSPSSALRAVIFGFECEKKSRKREQVARTCVSVRVSSCFSWGMHIGPIQFPSGGSILGVAIICLVVSAAVTYSSNRVGPVKGLIGPK